MSFRVVTIGDSGAEHFTQYHFLNQAEEHYRIASRNPFWNTVRLTMWVDGVGRWATVHSATPRVSADWHASPVTHSYA